MKNLLYSNNTLSRFIKNPITWAFLLPLLYWIYLAFATTMEIKFDAAAYEKLAFIIYHDGWINFFKSEPVNVPLYPFIISISMRIADFFSLYYLSIQTLFQILFFLTSQILLYKALKILNINRNIIALVLLYFGLSPAIVNSAFSLFCEIVTYPLVLGAILISVWLWQTIQEDRYKKIFLSGLCLTLFFILLTAVRAVYEYVLPLFLLAYLGLSLGLLLTKQKKIFINTLILLIAIFSAFHLSLLPYKLMNHKYNGHKALVNKGASAIYANTAARTRKLNAQNVLTFAARIPGEFVCTKLFGKKACEFWWSEAHVLGRDKKQELKSLGVPNDQLDSALYNLGKKEILKNLPQYTILTAASGLTMLFWESTQIGFVNYPLWMQNVFRFTLFKNILRLFIFLLTSISLLYTLVYVWKNKKTLFNPLLEKNKELSMLFFILTIILINIVLHSPFLIATRYAFPIAPLYLILIAFTAQKIFLK